MIAQKEDDAVGYKRPPKAYRWKKGQSGNPGRKRPRGWCQSNSSGRL
jgi:hypothetical protein